MKNAQAQCACNLEEVIRTIDSAVRDYTFGTTLRNRRNIIAGVVLAIVCDALENTYFRNKSSEKEFLSLAGVNKGGTHRFESAADKLSDAIDESFDFDEDHVEKSACHAGNSTGETFVGSEFEQCSLNLQKVIRIIDSAVSLYLSDAGDTTRTEIIASVVMKIVGDALDTTFVRKSGKSPEFFSTSGLRKGDSPRANSAAYCLAVAIRNSYDLEKFVTAKKK